MKHKKILFIILFFAIILFTHKCYAGNLNLDYLQYDVNLNSDGSANVKETWEIKINDTNTLFKTFEMDSSKYSGITDVTVVETTGGTSKNFIKQNYWQYHVNKGYYYGVINNKKQFEIAWGVDEKNSTRTFEINYTIKDAIKNYNDCSEFYWQFISTESAIPAKKIVGTINLPESNVSVEDIKVWAHGPLNGNISRESNSKVVFDVDNLSENTMLEARVVTPTSIFYENDNYSERNKLNTILSQEQSWADKANEQRNRETLIFIIILGIIIVLNIIGIIIAIFIIKKIKNYKNTLAETPLITPSTPLKYFRDIPNENSTPAQAGFLYYFKNGGLDYNISKIISATFLDLCMKNYISFEVSSQKKNDITITLNNSTNVVLPADEKIVYNLLVKVISKNSNNSCTMKDFKKYCEKHSSEFITVCSNISKEAKNLVQADGNYNKTLIENSTHWSSIGVGYVFLTVFGFIPFIACIIPSIISAYYCFKISSRCNTLTQKGIDEKENWTGLKNYMNDFSLLKEKEVPELALWEKYLVYATAFGIADKVLQQLKVIYPQISDYNYMSTHGYSYLYWTSINGSFIRNINTSVTSAYTSTHYSSGSGAGGGFSVGGGFGGGGGRNGWQINM